MKQTELNATAYIFEKERGFSLDDYQIEAIAECGFQEATPNNLSKKIISSLENNEYDDNFRTTAYWALGKKEDKELLGTFRAYLKKELTKNIRVAYQVMIALEDLGEDIFDQNRGGGFSFDDDELNAKDASTYLRNL